MSVDSAIAWTTSTWNPVVGCSRVSPGCLHCYAERMAHRFSGTGERWQGLTARSGSGSRWTGKVLLHEDRIDLPLRWRAAGGQPRRIFVCSMGDLFHPEVPDAFIDRVFTVMLLAPQHRFQLLTKRPERMLEYCKDPGLHLRLRGIAEQEFRPRYPQATMGVYIAARSLPPWLWAGVSVEDQEAADRRIPLLLSCPGETRFVSVEPQLEPVDLSVWLWGRATPCDDCPRDIECDCGFRTRRANGEASIDWVICGSETGPGARPFNPAWARDLRDQCVSADVPFFLKQMGARPGHDRVLDGQDWNQFPKETSW